MRNLIAWMARRWRGEVDIPPGVVDMEDITHTGDILMGPVDMLGNTIQVFSRIAYPAAFQRNKTQMAVGRVTEIKPDGGLIVEVEKRSREDSVKRSLVPLTSMGARNVVVIG